MSSNSIPVFDDIVHVERAASMTLSRRQRAELPGESISVYLMYGDEITLTRGTGALWQLGAGPASLMARLAEALERNASLTSKRRRAGLAARHRAPQRQAQCLAAAYQMEEQVKTYLEASKLARRTAACFSDKHRTTSSCHHRTKTRRQAPSFPWHIVPGRRRGRGLLKEYIKQPYIIIK